MLVSIFLFEFDTLEKELAIIYHFVDHVLSSNPFVFLICHTALVKELEIICGHPHPYPMKSNQEMYINEQVGM